MRTDTTTGGGGPSADGTARLVPILARAAELGRGPPWLVQWVRTELGPGPGGGDRAAVRRLAGDLARRLGRGVGMETLPDRPPPSWGGSPA